MQAGSPDHIDQGIEAKPLDLAAHEIRGAWLGNTKQLGRLRLAQACPGDMILHSHHQRGTELHALVKDRHRSREFT